MVDLRAMHVLDVQQFKAAYAELAGGEDPGPVPGSLEALFQGMQDADALSRRTAITAMRSFAAPRRGAGCTADVG